MKLFPNLTSIPFNYLLISWVTNYVSNRGFFTCLWPFILEGRSRTHSLKSLELKFWLKVIPLFCAELPLLHTILRHPRWRRFFPLARKEQTRAAFAELKLLFAIIMLQIRWQLPSLLSKNKKMKKKCGLSRSLQWFFTTRPSSCGIRCPGWGFGRGLWSLWDSAAALQLHEWDSVWPRIATVRSRLLTYVVQTPSVEGQIVVEQIRPTVAPKPRKRDQSLI